MDDVRMGPQIGLRPLHMVLILPRPERDVELKTLNIAVRGLLRELRCLQEEAPFRRLLIRAATYDRAPEWHIEVPTPIREVDWRELEPGEGCCSVGAALKLVAHGLDASLMRRSLPSIIVLVVNGCATDDFDAGVEALLASPWGEHSSRVALAVRPDVDLGELQRFIGASHEYRPIEIDGYEQIAGLALPIVRAYEGCHCQRRWRQFGHPDAEKARPQPPMPSPPTSTQGGGRSGVWQDAGEPHLGWSQWSAGSAALGCYLLRFLRVYTRPWVGVCRPVAVPETSLTEEEHGNAEDWDDGSWRSNWKDLPRWDHAWRGLPGRGVPGHAGQEAGGTQVALPRVRSY